MSLLSRLQEVALPLERSEFYRNIALFLGALTLMTLGIMYYNYSKTTELRASLQKMYKSQQEAKAILDRFKIVKKQRDDINTLLEEDKGFKLKSYFDDVVAKKGLSSYQIREAEVSEDLLQKLYTEIKIIAQFRGISTKQLCELLQAIEEKTRVYTKELSINKKNNSLDVVLTIATLKSYANKKG